MKWCISWKCALFIKKTTSFYKKNCPALTDNTPTKTNNVPPKNNNIPPIAVDISWAYLGRSLGVSYLKQIQCTLWPILIKLLYNVKGWTTKRYLDVFLRGRELAINAGRLPPENMVSQVFHKELGPPYFQGEVVWSNAHCWTSSLAPSPPSST